MKCPHCRSDNTRPTKKTTSIGYPVFNCQGCDRTFNRLQFPTDIVLLVVLWRLRYKLSLRDVAEMFLARGFAFTHEAIRDWETRCTPLLADQLRLKRRGQAGGSCSVNETYIKVHGKWYYVYRAIDHDGNLVDSMVSEKRNMEAAKRFFKQAVEVCGHVRGSSDD